MTTSPSSSTLGSGLAEMILEAVRFARTGEALLAAASSVAYAAQALTRVGDIDVELAPELTAALQNLSQAGEAISMALVVADTRYEITVDRVTREGGSSDASS